MKERRTQTTISYVTSMMIFFLLFTSLTAYSQRSAKYRSSYFQPGDAVEIEIIEVMAFQGGSGASLSNINDDYSIARDGTIFMPLIGKLKVTGHNQESLVELLNEKFSPYFKEPFITVTPLIRLTVMGAFNKPGSYRIDPNESLWKLIDLAGGPDDECDLNSLRVERGGDVVITNLLTSFEKGHSLSEIGVRSGDQVIAKYKKHLGMRDILDWVKFGVTLVVLYLQIERISN